MTRNVRNSAGDLQHLGDEIGHDGGLEDAPYLEDDGSLIEHYTR